MKWWQGVRITMVFICIHFNGFAQKDSTINSYIPGADSTVYSAIYRIISANQPVSYLTFFPVFQPLEQRLLQLSDGEGQNGYLLEGKTDLALPLIQGINQNQQLWKSFRLTLNLGFFTRMSDDHSHPVMPGNMLVGFGLDKILWDSYTGSKGQFSRLPANQDNWLRHPKALTIIYANLLTQHYSNGQQGEVLLDEKLRRNNYRNGDFSTNFARLSFTISRLTDQHALFTASLGYQVEVGRDGGALSFHKEQEKSYGRHRMLSFMQWRSRPFELIRRTSRLFGRYDFYNHKTGKQYQVKSLYELLIRGEFEYILGDLSLYPHQKKHPLGVNLFFQLNPLRASNVGLLAHFYAGRDYLNIRYDDVVWSLQLGVSFTFDKYIPVGFQSKQAIVKELK